MVPSMSPIERPGRIPLTVIGGYLGAGKTTLVNHLLRHAGGRRIGVIVNDFGSIGIDAQSLAAGSPAGTGQIVSLPNGCVCCTIGSGLHDALAQLVALDPPPEHIVIEVSGVADPAVASAWATVAPFEPSGVVVLAAADSVREMAQDRYVGGEVTRQLVGADLILLTKSDLCEPAAVRAVEDWLDDVTAGVARLSIVEGIVPASVVLGVEPSLGSVDPGHSDHRHTAAYMTWDWSGRPATRSGLEAFLDAIPDGVLRLKGYVALDDGTRVWCSGSAIARRSGPKRDPVSPGPRSIPRRSSRSAWSTSSRTRPSPGWPRPTSPDRPDLPDRRIPDSPTVIQIHVCDKISETRSSEILSQTRNDGHWSDGPRGRQGEGRAASKGRPATTVPHTPMSRMAIGSTVSGSSSSTVKSAALPHSIVPNSASRWS